MKRVQLIEIAIIVVILVLGFRAIETILNVIVYSMYSFSSTFTSLGSYILPNLIQFGLYSVSFFVILKNRKWIANYILGKNEENDEVAIRIQQPELLYIIIIFLCITTLLSEISTIVIYAYDYFKTEVNSRYSQIVGFREKISLASFKVAAVKFVLTFVLLYFAKPLSNLFNKNIHTDQPPVAETTDKL